MRFKFKRNSPYGNFEEIKEITWLEANILLIKVLWRIIPVFAPLYFSLILFFALIYQFGFGNNFYVTNSMKDSVFYQNVKEVREHICNNFFKSDLVQSIDLSKEGCKIIFKKQYPLVLPLSKWNAPAQYVELNKFEVISADKGNAIYYDFTITVGDSTPNISIHQRVYSYLNSKDLNNRAIPVRASPDERRTLIEIFFHSNESILIPPILEPLWNLIKTKEELSAIKEIRDAHGNTQKFYLDELGVPVDFSSHTKSFKYLDEISNPNSGGNNLKRAFYFSAITIFTIGYGDIQPLNHWLQLILSIEAGIGILLIGVLSGFAYRIFEESIFELKQKNKNQKNI